MLKTEQSLGKYGRMALRYLQETNPQRYNLLKAQGELFRIMDRVDNTANEMKIQIVERLLEKDPAPKTDDILERTRHLNQKYDIAEEFVLRDVVYVAR